MCLLLFSVNNGHGVCLHPVMLDPAFTVHDKAFYIIMIYRDKSFNLETAPDT